MAGTREVSETKRRFRDAAIARTAKQLAQSAQEGADTSTTTTTMSEYLRADATQIVQNIEAKKWTATEVVSAYIRRAIEAQAATNPITEVLFEDALAQAKKLDEDFASSGQLKGPLHGVPVSVKDLYNIEGLDSTIGYTRFANRPATDTSECVQLLREAGGIIIVKTNVPQTMLSFECSNPLWGRTLHPLKSTDTGAPLKTTSSKVPKSEQERRFTCGGSSGGEAALLACDGAALGLGSDIGGSLRIPTAFCGDYSLKPSPGRTSAIGTTDPAPGFDGIIVCEGPMGRSVNDIRLGSKILLGQKRAKVPLAYREEVGASVKGKKLKFGYYLSDGVIKASPACQRAVTEAVEAVRAAGHECVAFTPPDVVQAMNIFIKLTSADGYKTLLSHLGPDPMEESLFLVTLSPRLPTPIRRTSSWLAKHALHDEMFATFMKNSRVRTTKSYLRAAGARDAYIAMWEKKVWTEMGFDGIIAPVLASPALPHGATKTLSPLAVGTILYNIVPSAVGIVPVTRVDPTKDQLSTEWLEGSSLGKKKVKTSKSSGLSTAVHEKAPTTAPAPATNGTLNSTTSVSSSASSSLHPTGPHGSRLIEQDLYEGGFATKKSYDPDVMAGLPLAVQIVGRLYDDEKVIEMMQIVDDALGDSRQRGFGPGASERYL